MHPISGVSPSQSEGDVNHSVRRTQWQSEHLDTDTRELLARDSAALDEKIVHDRAGSGAAQ